MEFLQYLWSGLAAGALYATVAMGFTLLFKTTGVINFAFGAMAATGTAVALLMLSGFGFPYWAAAICACIVSALLGIALERFLFRAVMNQDHLVPLILSLGVEWILIGILNLYISDPLPFPKPVEGEMIKVAGIYISPESLMVLAIVTVIMLALYLFFTFTMLGIALRAAAHDMVTSRLMGIPTNAVFAVSWVVATILGTVAGMLTAPTTAVTPNFMSAVFIKGITGAILGGLGNLPGALVGGLLVGMLENVIGGYISSEMKAVFVFLILLVVLIVRPQGIMLAHKKRRA